MTKYVVHGTYHLKYQITVEANSSEEAKQEIKGVSVWGLYLSNEGKDRGINEINPTVEVIQEVEK